MIGTVGEVQRMDTTVISETVALAARLQGLTRTLGGQVLVSESTMRHISAIERFHYRMVGTFKAYHHTESIAVADFFDSDSLEIWEHKRASRRDFERAVYLHQSGQLEESRNAFESHLENFPADPVATYYLKQIEGTRAELPTG